MFRRAILAVTISTLGTMVLATQVPLNMNNRPSRVDPSFPQPGALGTPREGHVGWVGAADPTLSTGITLADTLTIDRRGGLWWDYARDVSAVTARLSVKATGGTTIMVPVDRAIMALPRKPHQGDGTDTEESIKAHVEKFLSAHIIPGAVDLPTTEPAQTLLEGLSVQIVPDANREGRWRVQPGDIEILDVREASNGRILYLNGVVQP